MRKPFDDDYPITQIFGITSVTNKIHTGVDYAMPVGTPLFACEDGTVTYINVNQADTGNAVEYKSDEGDRVWRSVHMNSFNVSKGERVAEGKLIGYSGNTGTSTGPHLHQDVKVNGVYQDPEKIYGEDMYEGRTAEDWATQAKDAERYKQQVVRSLSWKKIDGQIGGGMNENPDNIRMVIDSLEQFKADVLSEVTQTLEPGIYKVI